MAMVQVVQRPLHQWDLNVCVGEYTHKMCVKIKDEDEGWQEETYAIKDCEIIASPRDAAITPDISLPSKLSLIRLQFGIGTKHLADALGVERPTVYAWQKEESRPQDKRRERIETLLELAKYWQSLCEQSLGKRAFEPVDNGKSVVDLLKEDAISVERVKGLLRKWANSQAASREKLKAKALALRASMNNRGIKPLSEELVNQTLRDLSKIST